LPTRALLQAVEAAEERLDGFGPKPRHLAQTAAARRRLEIQPRHAERRVAHEVHAELVGRTHLGANRETEPGAELV